jgi:predicted phosphohydrolase
MAPVSVVGDVLLLAGDISDGGSMEAVFDLTQHYRAARLPVFYTPGNHEYYGRVMSKQLRAMHRACRGSGVTLLHNRVTTLGNVRIFGSTLWTDYSLDGAERQAAAMGVAAALVLDHRRILLMTREGQRYLTPADALAAHRKALAILRRRLASPWSGPTVVMTHHAPSPRSVHPRFAGHPANGAFVSDLESVMRELRPDLWVHGHTHNGFDYRVGSTRVLANPRGYPVAEHANGFENAAFAPELVVTV